MNVDKLRSGLYLVSTPIGNLKDITLRALETLKSADAIFCEDTRFSYKLLNHFGIKKPLFSYHEHNAEKVRPLILERIRSNETIALISDAGTPLISDPGYKLVQKCYENNFYVSVIPGACALISGIVLSGLPTDHFIFAGFVKKSDFEALKDIPYTLVFYGSPHKLLKDLEAMELVFNNRFAVLVREITKIYEEVKRGSFHELITHYKSNPARGEFVIILSPPLLQKNTDNFEIDQLLKELINKMSLNDAAKIISKNYKISKKTVYGKGLRIMDTSKSHKIYD